MKQLDNKVALITGGSSGIGLATAKRFSEEGAKVIITGRNAETLQQAMNELGDDNALSIKHDIGDIRSHENLFRIINEKYGKLG